ncbi:hydrogenase accessory protein HypB [Rhodoferax ferrireducens T118]|uniref:Hydrogenase maturation factor HypB n=1 Tax=Albidiferax ferrireducens (strain ATCC BAA-621 / DSM 15236 / T118) TaxID=338969 RepID=Q21R09_ALBFT|nr:hydrogenase nickel incorporation protein HypB [Rhodoferax ferrireducens]ABD71794.1 hydrogenase accessory protein HypB [Rhodoferax ferrireducens T118]
MCVTCGCGVGEVKIKGEQAHTHDHVHPDGSSHSHDHPHDHAHTHDHADSDAHLHSHDETPAHAHAPGVTPKRMVQIEQDILAKNNAYAQANRQNLAERGIFALNLVSSPGSGKTTLLCKTIALLGQQAVAVIEGDQQTSQDADRIRATGAQAIQINTGKGCHLDAHMVGHAMEQLKLEDESLLMIENVGNLVCPAAFDLGEAHKVVILSVTEGEDKPIKYPDMFRAASLMLLNKIDLLPHLNYDVDAAIGFARRVNPGIHVIELSATSGEGMDEWLAFLRDGVSQASADRQQTVDGLKARIAHLEARLQAQA